jgi:hypothetical protein
MAANQPAEPASPAEPMTPREEFLQKMYEQMFRDIAQQLNTVWQAVATLFGSFAIIALAEKGIISIDFSVTIIIVLSGWFILTVNECGYWYNRNLAIVANIERQFLRESDLKEIVYYFGKHRPRNKMISQLKIQIMLGSALVLIVCLYHFSTRIYPGIGQPVSGFEPTRSMPYIALVLILWWIWWIVRKRNAAYEEFMKYSPGLDVDTSSIAYGVGHGFGPGL